MNGANGVFFGYDNDDLLITAGALTLRRDTGNGLLTGTTLGGVIDSYTYNTFGEPTAYNVQLNGANIFTLGYTRDDGGRIAVQTETVNGTTTLISYNYDAAGRLGASYFYSDKGELQKKIDASGPTTYDYDVLGNLRQVVLSNGDTIDYVIDAMNRRVGKKLNGILTAGWLYADSLRIIAETDATGAVIKRFVYGTRSNVPDYMLFNGVTYRIISDARGSVRYVIESTAGTVAQTLTYDAWGNVLTDTNPGVQPFAFAGGLYDPHTHLTRFGARDYDPSTVRWIAKDPLLFGGGDTNVYGYTFGDPINLIDPDGMRPLTRCVQQSLRKFFPDIDLSKVDVEENTKWLSRRFPAMTAGNTIYFRGAAPDAGSVTPGGMNILAHELTHVEQYQDEGGVFWFLDRYTSDAFKHGFGHDRIPYEQEAIRREQAIRNQLQRNQGSTYCGCP